MAAPARRTTSHLANGSWAATTRGFHSARYATQLVNWLRLHARAGVLPLGRCGAVREEKSNVAVFVSSGKSQHDDGLGADAITSERAPPCYRLGSSQLKYS